MATAVELFRRDGVVCFTLSNKPQFKCYIDEEDYQLVEFNTCWYIHHKVDEEQHMYIRRAIYNGSTYEATEMLHDFVAGNTHKKHRAVFHLDRNGLNNTKKNLSFTHPSNILHENKSRNPRPME